MTYAIVQYTVNVVCNPATGSGVYWDVVVSCTVTPTFNRALAFTVSKTGVGGGVLSTNSLLFASAAPQQLTLTSTPLLGAVTLAYTLSSLDTF